MIRHLTVALLASLVGLACGSAEAPEAQGPTLEARCDDVIGAISGCYPEAAEAQCTEQSVAEFERLGDGFTCDALDGLGKADFFAFGGCDAGQHVCGWFLCCGPYDITWEPQSEADWDFVELVKTFQSETPQSALAELAEIIVAGGVGGVSFIQDVVEYRGQAARALGVHITTGRVDMPYSEFIGVLPPAEWGINLAHYLGGELRALTWDAEGRPVRQLERMVLSPIPFDGETPLTNNDMTKLEIVEYEAERATVYWRVMHSDNNTTETDVGSVEFRAEGASGTRVTFHSAHRLNALGGPSIPLVILQKMLVPTFSDFVRGYQQRVE
jgi:hypothetical protein